MKGHENFCHAMSATLHENFDPPKFGMIAQLDCYNYYTRGVIMMNLENNLSN